MMDNDNKFYYGLNNIGKRFFIMIFYCIIENLNPVYCYQISNLKMDIHLFYFFFSAHILSLNPKQECKKRT